MGAIQQVTMFHDPSGKMPDHISFIDNPAWPNIIEFKKISQYYPGRKDPVILDLDLIIEDKPGEGQFVVILGPSGCGKSTLLRYACKLQNPTSGEVLLNGRIINHNDHINMVFQNYSSFWWYTVLENVMLPLLIQGISRKEAKERAMDIINKVGLSGHENKWAIYPALSGGQLQRVAIARSLITNPKILLMDEPYGALDIVTRFKMQELISHIYDTTDNITIIFVTHDIEEAVFLADDIYVMDANPGRIVQRFHPNLPSVRTWETKDDLVFIQSVHEVRNFMRSFERK